MRKKKKKDYSKTSRYHTRLLKCTTDAQRNKLRKSVADFSYANTIGMAVFEFGATRSTVIKLRSQYPELEPEPKDE